MYLQLQEVIEKLNQIHEGIIQTHENDFLAAYKEHMVKVQVEVMHAKKKTSNYYHEMRKNERMRFLE